MMTNFSLTKINKWVTAKALPSSESKIKNPEEKWPSDKSGEKQSSYITPKKPFQFLFGYYFCDF